jgi:hypothetical protein
LKPELAMHAAKLRTASSLFLTALLVACAGGCAASADDVGDGSQDIVGGNDTVESPTVYLFDSAGNAKCAGVLINDTFAVTAKACAQEGMTVARAIGSSTSRATVTSVNVPDGADADIAVVELNRAIGGTHAVITHVPLRDGYTINGISSVGGTGLGTVKAASVRAQMISETELHGSIIASRGSQICGDDIGAPVCSSVRATVDGIDVLGTCGLAGIIVGPPESATPAATTPTTTTTGTTPTAPTTPPAKVGCVDGPWKVAELGRHAEFLRRFAPEAFSPLQVDQAWTGMQTIIPEGLWGYKSNGSIRSCKIATQTLDAIAPNAEAKLTATVTFGSMQERSAPYGRFGLAPKTAPQQVRWFPAQAPGTPRGTSFDMTFSGSVVSERDGDFIVLFRTSANGGETWTQCDSDGIDNGVSVDKMLPLKVGAGDAATTTPTSTPASPTTAPAATDPQPTAETPPGGNDSPSGETPPGADDKSKTKDTKKKKASGCAASPLPTSGGTSLPLLGVALGLGALVRRRRSR